MADKRFVFTVELGGFGPTEQDAWIDAVEQFCQDPGEPLTSIEEWEEDQ